MAKKKQKGKGPPKPATNGGSSSAAPKVPPAEPARKKSRTDEESDEEYVDRMMSEEPSQAPSAPLTAEQLKEKGNDDFRAKRYEDSIDWYSKAIAADPTDATFLMNRAAAYIALKRFSSALADCQVAHSLQSANPQPKTLLRLSKCQLALGDAASALSSARSALAIDDPAANATARQAVEKAALVQKHLERYMQARANGEWTMARFALQEAERESEGGDGVQWRCWRIEADIAGGKLDDAASAVGDALRLDRESTEVLYLRGLIFFLQNQIPKAVSHSVEVLRLDPDHTRARQLMRRAKAVESIKEAGNTAFKEGRLEDALSSYTEALDLVGEKKEEASGGIIRAVLLSNRATALVKLQRLDDALEDVTNSLKLQPASYKALRTRARIYLAKEDYEEAVREFGAALKEAQGTPDERSLQDEERKAQVALKRSKTKDYYKILGVDRECNETDIKKAYRRESLKHHPDKGGDEEKFKLVQEANSVLSDPQRRRRYDLGEDEDGGSSGMGGMNGMSPEDFAQIFSMMGGGGGRRSGFGGGSSFGGSPFGGGGYSSYSGF